MQINIRRSDDVFVEHGEAVEEILRRAVQAALAVHKRAGNRIASWQDERIIVIEANEIPVSIMAASEQI